MRIEPSRCRVRQRDGLLAIGRLASKKPARAFQDLAETPAHKASGRVSRDDHPLKPGAAGAFDHGIALEISEVEMDQR